MYHHRGVGADFQKPKKIFSDHNEKRSMKRGEKWFSEKLRKIVTLNFFGPSDSRYVPITYKGRAPVSELVLLRGGLPSEIALQGVSLESKIVYHYRGVGADFHKPNKYFRLTMKSVE